jgi:creatinine amidohydrolase
MKFEFCTPDVIERAKADSMPLIIPCGTMEYHGRHCAYGCDTLIVTGLLERLERKRELLIAPPIWYSPSSYAVADKASGTVHVCEDVFEQYVYYILKSYLYSGFRKIYIVIQHQYENESLMPMTLCCMKAAKVLTMDYLEETSGQGWWGSEKQKEYYETLIDKNANPFGWIEVIPAMSAAAQQATGYDHAGKFETSLLMALYPEAVKKESCKDNKHWYTASAIEANAELGEKMAALSLTDLDKRIR